jgi:Lrp/AsnC family transcriptional regulator for asnA, asnC and gidA
MRPKSCLSPPRTKPRSSSCAGPCTKSGRIITASDYDELNRIIKMKITPLGVEDMDISIIMKAVREIAEVNILSVDEKEALEASRKKKEMAPTPSQLKSSGMKLGEALKVGIGQFK